MRDYYQIHREILKTLDNSGIELFNVSEIRLFKNDYKEFLKETKEKGFSVSIWGIPVVEQDIIVSEQDLDSIYIVMK